MKRLAIVSLVGGLLLALPSCTDDSAPVSGERAAPTPTAIRGAPPEILAPSPWTDPAGDVTLPNADMVGGTVVVGDGIVQLRVQFVDPPFPTTATHFIDWCIDLDQNPSTGFSCGLGGLIGADASVGCHHVPGNPLPLFVLQGHGGAGELA